MPSETNNAIGSGIANSCEGESRRACAVFAGMDVLACKGVHLQGDGFVLSRSEAYELRQMRAESRKHIRPFCSAPDIIKHPQGRWVIDLFGLTEAEVQYRFPRIYWHLFRTVKPERDVRSRRSPVNSWWLHSDPRPKLREAITGKKRYIVTAEKMKHRAFQFVDASTLPDARVVAIASESAALLSLLSSKFHILWASHAAHLNKQGEYCSSRCFSGFPFHSVSNAYFSRLEELGERLDEWQKELQIQNPKAGIGRMYSEVEAYRQRRQSTKFTTNKPIGRSALLLAEVLDEIDVTTAEALCVPRHMKNREILDFLIDLSGSDAKSRTEFFLDTRDDCRIT
ncbi:type IIL restriction-modification enzyme MmeI [Nioella sp. MMSF_3534]|uniref:type IIL restriction-modification enzyme MmeI n=1 Tax=Nioella sp. MMSF_3534 TaxID=3046720 RepID=UPI00273D615C|nr:type IIL restriction-modification enzyme MmeI [Nioella sp. MMSF_3534]